MQLDATIRVSDLILLGGGLITGVKVFLVDRDIKRDLMAIVKIHEARLVVVEAKTDEHHEWLVRGGLDQFGRRAYDRPPGAHE